MQTDREIRVRYWLGETDLTTEQIEWIIDSSSPTMGESMFILMVRVSDLMKAHPLYNILSKLVDSLSRHFR